MFLSFVIPVYNAETYICECLNSLVEQDISKEEYEILCVNDGSWDGSLEILKAYEASYPNITVIDKENGGVTTARNAGLAAAKGDYIWFVDSDDFIKENCLSRLMSAARETDCDRMIFGGYQFTDFLTPDEQERSLRNELPANTPWYDSVVWRCLLRRSFLLEHDLSFRYPELTHGEDGLFMYEVTLHSPRDTQTEEILYFYREHSGSAETSPTPENRKRKLRSYTRITQILHDHYTSGRTDAITANKLMSFLWFSLYELTQLPAEDARPILTQLKESKLFPYTRPEQCTLETSYMTDRTDLLGKLFDKLYLNLHTQWGYTAMRMLQRMRGRN